MRFNNLPEFLEAFPNEDACYQYMESVRWPDGPISPFAPDGVVYRCKGNKYKCKTTGKYFTVLNDTIFMGSKIKLQKWFLAAYFLSGHKKGVSSYQLSRDLGVTQKTAWYMLQRLRHAMRHPMFQTPLAGVVQVDEAYQGTKERHAAGPHGDKNTVLGMKEKKGDVRAVVLPDAKRKTLTEPMKRTIIPGSTIHTDQYHAYRGIAADLLLKHESVNHAKGEYVRGGISTNDIEAFWSVMKRGIYGIYHHTSSWHLQKYVDEYAFRFNSRFAESESRFTQLMTGAKIGVLPYKALLLEKSKRYGSVQEKPEVKPKRTKIPKGENPTDPFSHPNFW